jgi:hypothetical protein
MITVIFYKEIYSGLSMKKSLLRVEIETGKNNIHDAFLVALKFGANPDKNILYRISSKPNNELKQGTV